MREEKNKEIIEIKHIDNQQKGYFTATIDGRDAGLMTYVYLDGDRLVIDHTEVDEEFNGMGVGKVMVEEAVKFARNKDLKVVPLCAFAKAMFKRNPSYDDVFYKP